MTDEKKLTKKSHDILSIMASKNNLDPTQFLNTIKATIIRPGRDGKVATNEEIAAFLIVANKYNLDPFTNEIYAFPAKKGGIVPVVGIDGFVSQMNRNKDFNGMEITFAENESAIEGARQCSEWCEVKIYRKSMEHPIVVREYLDEVYCPPKGGYPGPWQSHTKRMLRHKAIIQAARIAFGITGIYDQDEADRILDAEAIEMNPKSNVATPERLDVSAPIESDNPSEEMKLLLKAQKLIGDESFMAIVGDHGYSSLTEVQSKDVKPILAAAKVIFDQREKKL